MAGRDDAMDYVYHAEHLHGQGPYSQQRRCPHFRGDPQVHPPVPPTNRSTPYYDPVHASASSWQAQPPQAPPHHWQPAMLSQHGTSSSFYRPPTASESPYYGQHPAFSYGLAGFQAGAPYDAGGLYPPFPITQLPPVRYTPHLNPPGGNQSAFSPERHLAQQPAGPSAGSIAGTASPSTPPTTQSALVQDSSDSSAESSPVPELPVAETTTATSRPPPANTSVQFGSAPPSSAPHHTLTVAGHRHHVSSSGGEHSTTPSQRLPLVFPGEPRLETSSTGPSSSSNAAQTAAERRRAHPPQRRIPRRQSPPSDREFDAEGEIRMLEHFLVNTGGRLMGHDVDDNHVRAAQFLRGSLSTKMVASSSAIQSLQTVVISDLSETERTCVICYNDFGVETPEGVKEAPLRLPKCKHVFGDHCIKKWFEESDSCPYCRDKVPSEPRMTSSNSAFNSLVRARALVRDRDLSHGTDDSGRSLGHGERRSPPSDGGENRRRIRPRHGSLRGPASPPFSGGSRPVSGIFGGSSANMHESTRRSHAFGGSRSYTSNAANRFSSAPPPIPFSQAGTLPPYHPAVPFGGHPDAATPLPPYGVPPTGHGAGFTTPTTRNSLPPPPPRHWHGGHASIPDDMHRRMMLGDGNSSNSTLQPNGAPHWTPQ